MAQMEVLSKTVNVDENGNIVVERSLKETLSRQELEMLKEDYKRKKLMKIEDSKRIKREYNELDANEKDIDELLAKLPEEKINTL